MLTVNDSDGWYTSPENNSLLPRNTRTTRSSDATALLFIITCPTNNLRSQKSLVIQSANPCADGNSNTTTIMYSTSCEAVIIATPSCWCMMLRSATCERWCCCCCCCCCCARCAAAALVRAAACCVASPCVRASVLRVVVAAALLAAACCWLLLLLLAAGCCWSYRAVFLVFDFFVLRRWCFLVE